MSFYALLSVAVLMHVATAEVYYVIPAADDSDFINETEFGNSLEYYLKDTSKYFSSDSQLHFKMGYHYLNTDLVIQNITNVTLTGESLCVIRCTSNVNIIVFNVTDFSLENSTFKNCSSNYSNYLHNDHYASISKHKFSSNASILLYHSMSVKINNIVILLSEGNTGMLVVNARNYSKITNIHITVQIICTLTSKGSLQTNGIMLYWNNSNKTFCEVQLDNFQFTTNGSCPHPIYYAIASLLLQNNRNIAVIIQNTIFNDLINVTALYYYTETCGMSISNRLTISNCIVSNNIGSPNLNLFHISLDNIKCLRFLRSHCLQQYTTVRFRKCNFENNFNMTSMIHILPASSQATTCHFYLTKSSFHNNTNIHFLIMKSDTDNIWQLSNNVVIQKVNITSNAHDEGQDLMSFTNCRVSFNGPIIILSNGYYTNIFNFHLFISIFYINNVNITNNTVRQILSGKFVIIRGGTAIDISRNKVYILLNQIWTYSLSSESICKVQF